MEKVWCGSTAAVVAQSCSPTWRTIATAYMIFARDAALSARDIYKNEQGFTAGWIACASSKIPRWPAANFARIGVGSVEPDRAAARRILAGPRRGSGPAAAQEDRDAYPRQRTIDKLFGQLAPPSSACRRAN